MRLQLLTALLFISTLPMFSQTTKGSLGWEDAATRDEMPREGYMDEIVLNVGEVINIYADMEGIADSTYESWMNACWTDHAWVYYMNGTVNNDYVLINHTDSSRGLSTIMGLKPCKRALFEIYYSVTWTCSGDNTKYVAQSQYYFYITVKDVKATSISLPETAEVKEGKYITLTPVITPSEANPKLNWTSSNESVATVDQSGKVYGVSEGKADIKVETDNGKSAICSVSVIPQPTAVSFSGSSFEITQGFMVLLNPTFTPANATSGLKWESSDTNVVKVYSSGKALGVKTGIATVKCTTENNLSTECTVKVVQAKDGLDINTVMSKFSKVEGLLKESVEKLNVSGNE